MYLSSSYLQILHIACYVQDIMHITILKALRNMYIIVYPSKQLRQKLGSLRVFIILFICDAPQ